MKIGHGIMCDGNHGASIAARWYGHKFFHVDLALNYKTVIAWRATLVLADDDGQHRRLPGDEGARFHFRRPSELVELYLLILASDVLKRDRNWSCALRDHPRSGSDAIGRPPAVRSTGSAVIQCNFPFATFAPNTAEL